MSKICFPIMPLWGPSIHALVPFPSKICLFWLKSSCIFKDFNPDSHIVYVKGILMMPILGKPLGTGNYDFYTH